MKKKLVSLLCLLTLLISVLPGCNNGGNTQNESSPNEDVKNNEVASSENVSTKHVEQLVVGTTAENNVFNIMGQKDAFGKMNYNGLTQGNFVYVDENKEIQPYFFKTFEISEDGKTLVFTYPNDAIWHDGKPVTDEDILFTFDYTKNIRKSGSLANLESWEITGENECTLKFSEPDAFYYLNAGALNSCVLPKHIWENITEYSEYSGEDSHIGCGPYKLVSKDLDSQTSVYEAVKENSFLGELMVDKVVVQSYSGEDTLMMAMANGEIDAMFNYANPIDVSIIESFEGTPGLDLGQSDFGGHFQITYGMERNPGLDLEFRKACRLAFDYDKLAFAINGKYGKIPGTGIVSPIVNGFDDSLPKLERDLELANKILDDAGYLDIDGDGFREDLEGQPMDIMVTQQFSKNKEMYNRISEIVMASLKEVGIKTNIDEESLGNSEIWEANVTDGKYDIFIGFTTSGMTNWSSAFRYFIADPRIEGEKTWIWGTYHDDEFKNAFYKMQQSKSYEEYAEYMKTMQKLANDDIFAQSLCWEVSHFPYRVDKIGGWNNYPGYGVINSRTWFDLYQK